MPKSHKRFSSRKELNNWRDYQAGLQGGRFARSARTRSPLRGIVLAMLVVFVLAGLGLVLRHLLDKAPAKRLSAPSPPTPSTAPVAELGSKAALRQRLDVRAFSHLTERELTVPVAGSQLQVETTIDPGLQNYLLDTLDRINSRYVGIVVMAASSGKVLAMAGYDRTDSTCNPCLSSHFPAASIFKIVTAATAVDQCGYSADSPMPYCGPKHTLYKRQLVDKVDRFTTTIPLREAFADSINPVFGKLGILRLRKAQLEQAATTFGFNQPLDFELPLPPSQFRISDEPYNWAEVASGFNQDTTLSPLHGAALASAIVNSGRMVIPVIVEQIADAQGQELYRRPVTPEFRTIMSPRAASELSRMMESTVTTGTARKAFRRHQTDKILGQLQLGGKTGSIGSKNNEVRYDWFVGFARDRHGREPVVVAVMVAHEQFIGIRASDYARRALTYHFDKR